MKDYLVEKYHWTTIIFGEPRNRATHRHAKNTGTGGDDSIWSPAALGLQALDPNDPRIEACRNDEDMDPYEVCLV